MPIMRRRTALLAAAALGAPAPLRAQGGFPSRPVRVIIPFAAAGGADTFIRLISDQLGEGLGQPLIIENRPGAGATIGTDFVAKSPPDGHTILVISTAQTTNETLMPNRPYVLMRDLAPVAMVSRSHYVLVVTPGLPVRSAAELIAHAKANPGKLDYASSGPGTPYHFAGAVFGHKVGIDAQHVPFRQASDARNAVVAGQVHFMFDGIATMLPLMGPGRVRALATTGPGRSPILPDVPALNETVPDLVMGGLVAVMAPAATPRPILERLNTEFNRVLRQPHVTDAFRRIGTEVETTDIAGLDAILREDIVLRRDYVRLTGMVPQ
ncbi:MAG: tripartite tricarboxylate transporter substrate binding protein [Acetobacteraceae bacterium]|nr:tripartite tricarboxylate transporter substrate binding protein [Acetobacteraceae bacterium]